MAIYTSARETHAPTSKIYSRALEGHALAYVGQMEAGSMEDESDEAEKHDGMAHLRVGLPEIHRSEFEKPKSKNFKKMTNPPKGMVGEAESDCMVEEESTWLLLKEKTSKEIDRASKEADRAFKKAVGASEEAGK
jgi:hypothetical protein